MALLSQPLFSELDDSFAPTCSRLSSTLPRASCPQVYFHIYPDRLAYRRTLIVSQLFVVFKSIYNARTKMKNVFLTLITSEWHKKITQKSSAVVDYRWANRQQLTAVGVIIYSSQNTTSGHSFITHSLSLFICKFFHNQILSYLNKFIQNFNH